jgi:peptide/nickel transport system permease protein
MRGGRVLRRLRRDPLFWIGGTLVFLVIAMAALAGPLSKHAPDRRVTLEGEETPVPPNARYPLGTDENGYDVESRLLYGARTSLLTGLCAVVLALGVGVPLGAAAGWRGGFVDGALMRLTDVMLAFPSILLALAIAAAAGRGSVWTLVLAVGVVQIPLFMRQVRASVMQAKEEDWVTACRATGVPATRTLLRHVLPNCLAPILVLATLGVGSAILSAAGLSWLGLGPPATEPEWGRMLEEGAKYMREKEQWILVPPGVAISATVLGFNLLGDALRAALDPRLSR